MWSRGHMCRSRCWGMTSDLAPGTRKARHALPVVLVLVLRIQQRVEAGPGVNLLLPGPLFPPFCVALQDVHLVDEGPSGLWKRPGTDSKQEPKHTCGLRRLLRQRIVTLCKAPFFPRTGGSYQSGASMEQMTSGHRVPTAGGGSARAAGARPGLGCSHRLDVTLTSYSTRARPRASPHPCTPTSLAPASGPHSLPPPPLRVLLLGWPPHCASRASACSLPGDPEQQSLPGPPPRACSRPLGGHSNYTSLDAFLGHGHPPLPLRALFSISSAACFGDSFTSLFAAPHSPQELQESRGLGPPYPLLPPTPRTCLPHLWWSKICSKTE